MFYVYLSNLLQQLLLLCHSNTKFRFNSSWFLGVWDKTRTTQSNNEMFRKKTSSVLEKLAVAAKLRWRSGAQKGFELFRNSRTTVRVWEGQTPRCRLTALCLRGVAKGRKNSREPAKPDKDRNEERRREKSGQTFKDSFCQFSRQLPVDSQFTGRSGGWRRQAAAIRGLKTTYLAAFSLDTIIGGPGGGVGVLCHDGTYVCRLYLQIWNACDMKEKTSLHHKQAPVS